MELIQELGSRSWINGSGKKDSRKFGLFECPVCKIKVEKSLSHGKRDKNCGSKECRKATFERNPNQLQSSKANGNAKKSKYLCGDDPMWRAFSKVFYEMHSRCYLETHQAYKTYGALGISVCERWHDLNNFTIDMFEAYKEQMKHYYGTRKTVASIDRVDNTKNYDASNCEWIMLSNNTSKDKRIPVNKLDINGNIIATYKSMIDATKDKVMIGSKIIYPNVDNIARCCRGQQKEHVGYRWEFASDKVTKHKS